MISEVESPSPPLKWHGGKSYLAKRIVSLFPPHLHYVEPFAGGLAVLLAADPEGRSEVVNDLERELTNFWRVLQDEILFRVFRRILEATPFSQVEWEDADADLARQPQPPDSRAVIQLNRAVAFFIRCRQSLAGRNKGFSPISKTRVRRGMNEQASAWLSTVEGLPAVHERLKRVAILDSQDALQVIRGQDGEQTLYYLDPPYMPTTRASTDAYACEMTCEQHEDLLALLQTIKGKFLLSGYRCPLYDQYASANGWHRADFDLPNNAAGGKAKRRMTESVWANFSLPQTPWPGGGSDMTISENVSP